MSHDQNVNRSGVASLANVAVALTGLIRARDRASHLPGLVVFYGPSGYGKSTAAAVCSARLNAYYVEARSYWTRKSAVEAILKAMGLKPERTISAMAEQAAQQLAMSGRPLIIDELDHLADKGAIEIVRDLYEASLAPMLLIGEENLPNKLLRWERFHGRVLDWAPAQPADLDDARALRDLYCQDVAVADDLLGRIVDVAKGSVRRICVNLERVRAEALALGETSMDLSAWGGRELWTGQAPVRRLA